MVRYTLILLAELAAPIPISFCVVLPVPLPTLHQPSLCEESRVKTPNDPTMFWAGFFFFSGRGKTSQGERKREGGWWEFSYGLWCGPLAVWPIHRYVTSPFECHTTLKCKLSFPMIVLLSQKLPNSNRTYPTAIYLCEIRISAHIPVMSAKIKGILCLRYSPRPQCWKRWPEYPPRSF